MEARLSMADDEHAFLRQVVKDDELAREIADADTDSAVALLLRADLTLFAFMLWRNRTGDELKAAVAAVTRIREREGISFD